MILKACFHSRRATASSLEFSAAERGHFSTTKRSIKDKSGKAILNLKVDDSMVCVIIQDPATNK